MTNYQSGVVIEANPPIKESGELSISGNSLVFKNENRTISMRASTVAISLGGTANRTAYINDHTLKGTTLHTTDIEFFRHEVFNLNDTARRLFRHKKEHHTAFIVTFILLFLAVAIPFWLVFIERSIVVSAITKQVSPEVEVLIGDTLFDLQFGLSSNIIDDEEVNQRLQKLIKPLLKAATHPDYIYKVHIIKDKSINAFAIPGGHIVIHSGLIEKSDTPEELLGVLAHEMAHVTKRHSLKQVIQKFTGWAMISFIGFGTDHVIMALGDKAAGYLSLGYSREQELEADDIGMEYLQKAQISAKGFLKFFDKIKAEESLLDNNFLTFMSTHPATDERIERMKKLVAENSYNVNKVLFDYKGFKDLLNSTIKGEGE